MAAPPSPKALLALLPAQTQFAASLFPKPWRESLLAVLPSLYRLHRVGTRAEYDGWAQLPEVTAYLSRLQTTLRRVIRRVPSKTAKPAGQQLSMFGGAPAQQTAMFDALSEKVWVDEPDGSIPLPAPATLGALIIAPETEITPAEKRAVMTRYVDTALANAPGQMRLAGRAPSQQEVFEQAIHEATRRTNRGKRRRPRSGARRTWPR